MDLIRNLAALPQPLLFERPGLTIVAFVVIMVFLAFIRGFFVEAQLMDGAKEDWAWPLIACAAIAAVFWFTAVHDPSADERLEVFATYLADEHELIVVKDANYDTGRGKDAGPSFTATAVTPDGDFVDVTVTWLDLDPDAPDLPDATDVVTVTTTPSVDSD